MTIHHLQGKRVIVNLLHCWPQVLFTRLNYDFFLGFQLIAEQVELGPIKHSGSLARRLVKFEQNEVTAE